jgi:hypothetical protein
VTAALLSRTVMATILLFMAVAASAAAFTMFRSGFEYLHRAGCGIAALVFCAVELFRSFFRTIRSVTGVPGTPDFYPLRSFSRFSNHATSQ